MRFRGWWGYILAMALVAAACTAETVEVTEPAPATTTSTTAEATTTSTVPVGTSTTVAVEIRLPANDVDDPTEAIVAISDFYTFLFTVPEQAPDYLGLIYLDSCDCYDKVLSYLDTYVTEGWVQDDEGIEVHAVSVSQSFDNGDVLLEVTDSWAPQYVVDNSGNRIRLEDDEWTKVVSLIGLERGDDSRWRIAVIGVLGESTG